MEEDLVFLADDESDCEWGSPKEKYYEEPDPCCCLEDERDQTEKPVCDDEKKVITINKKNITVLKQSIWTSPGQRYDVHRYTLLNDEERIDIILKDDVMIQMMTTIKSHNTQWLYENEKRISSFELFKNYYHKLMELVKGKWSKNKSFIRFLDTIQSLNEEYIVKWNNMIKDNKIHFDALWYYFPKGSKVYFIDNDCLQGAEIWDVSYRDTMTGALFIVEMLYITSNGECFLDCSKKIPIEKQSDVFEIDSLFIKHINKEIEEKLIENGRNFERIALDAHYMNYKGSMFKKTWFGNIFFSSNGRIMVDSKNILRFDPNYPRENIFSKSSYSTDNKQKKIKEEHLYRTKNTVFGFSFVSKRWGEFFINDISEIEFKDDAFDRLVMDQKRKTLVKCLVKNSNTGNADIISGKGGGCIILLHGPPGVG